MNAPVTQASLDPIRGQVREIRSLLEDYDQHEPFCACSFCNALGLLGNLALDLRDLRNRRSAA